jgi:hypothetical protein
MRMCGASILVVFSAAAAREVLQPQEVFVMRQ